MEPLWTNEGADGMGGRLRVHPLGLHVTGNGVHRTRGSGGSAGGHSL
ncbi:MAG: hypothetical protein AAF517_06045 [Planctomycetota bacterium]